MTTRKFAILIRAAVQISFAAARIGCSAQDYFLVYPHLRIAIARRAIQDIRDAALGLLLNGGMTDCEALEAATLHHKAWVQPISALGNARADMLRNHAERLRRRGADRLRQMAA